VQLEIPESQNTLLKQKGLQPAEASFLDQWNAKKGWLI
jgi:hypothetical protein